MLLIRETDLAVGQNGIRGTTSAREYILLSRVTTVLQNGICRASSAQGNKLWLKLKETILLQRAIRGTSPRQNVFVVQGTTRLLGVFSFFVMKRKYPLRLLKEKDAPSGNLFSHCKVRKTILLQNGNLEICEKTETCSLSLSNCRMYVAMGYGGSTGSLIARSVPSAIKRTFARKIYKLPEWAFVLKSNCKF